MSENKHTSGEWKYNNITGYVISSQRLIVKVYADLPELEKNGNLIAAAPELLKACEAVLQQLTSKYPVVIQPDVEPYCIKVVKKAVAKAKGEN